MFGLKKSSKELHICVLMDLFNREIIGYSTRPKKYVPIVMRAFASMNRSLENINIFHPDRGSEFKNKTIGRKP